VSSWVRVQRLSYEEVETRLNEEPFGNLHRIAQANEERRQANGAISIDLPEVKVRVVAGEVMLRPLLPLKSRDLVREAMLMAGEALARLALTEDIPFPFTTQAAPDGGDFSDDMSGMFALRRTLKRSQVKSLPGPHAGLGLEVYTQVTSPLRRYADLLAHQQLRAYLKGDDVLTAAKVLERVGAAEAITGNVRQAERLANKHWTLVYLLNHPDWHGEGVLVEKRNLRGLVLIPSLDLETRVHLRQDLPLDSTIPLTLNNVNLAGLETYFRVEA
jgi:exoribonuclease-2